MVTMVELCLTRVERNLAESANFVQFCGQLVTLPDRIDFVDTCIIYELLGGTDRQK